MTQMDILAGMRKAKVTVFPIHVTLISLGSPDHYTMWNDLSTAVLKGDIMGHFGSKVVVDLLRASQEHEVDQVLKELCRNELPDIIGISAQPGSLNNVRKLVGGIRQCPEYEPASHTVVFGNQIATYHPEEVLRICQEGTVVRGEGELSLRGLVRYKMGLEGLCDIPNLVYQSDGEIMRTPLERPDISKLIHPADSAGYRQVLARGGNVMTQTSRGCSWGGCLYCTRTSFRNGGEVVQQGSSVSWTPVPAERVEAEISAVFAEARSLGLAKVELEIADDEFFGGREDFHAERVHVFIEIIKRAKMTYGISDFSFRLFTRPGTIYRARDSDKKNQVMRELLHQLKAIGLVQVYIGVEAGSDEQLAWYRRGTNLNETLGTLSFLEELGLGIDVGFIMFYPDLTLRQMVANTRLYREWNLMHYNQWPFRPMVVNEGSRACHVLAKRGILATTADPNFMAYKYVYSDSDVTWIQGIVESLSSLNRNTMYALKVKSKKYFDPRKKDAETLLCQAHVEKNGHIFLDLMEELATGRLAGQSHRSLQWSIERARGRISDQLASIRTDINRGRISDDDGFIARALPTAASERSHEAMCVLK